MSTYTQYADVIRESQQTWDRTVEAVTKTATQSLVQVQDAVATAVKAEPFGHVVDYLARTFESQADVSKKLAAISAELTEHLLIHADALAAASRDYLGTAQEVLRDQAGKQYDDFTFARQQVEQALRHVTGAVEPQGDAA